MSELFHPLPQPEEIPIKEREDAMGAYLMMFAAVGAGLPLPIVNLIASVVYFYINRRKSRFVLFHSFQALISQIPVTILNASAVFWGIRIAFSEYWTFTPTFKGFLFAVAAANLAYFVFGIIAAVKARKGRMYYYWFFGKIAYLKAYRVSDELPPVAVNEPPRF